MHIVLLSLSRQTVMQHIHLAALAYALETILHQHMLACKHPLASATQEYIVAMAGGPWGLVYH